LKRRLVDNPPFTALGLLWPWLTPWAIKDATTRTDIVPPGAQPFRLVSANALGPNKRPARFAADATAIDTDVLLVVEASARILDALEVAEVHRFHQHGLIEKRPRWSGCGIWSRHPMELLEIGDAGHAYMAARVQLPAGPVTVVAVHTWAPAKPRSGPKWLASFAALGELLGRLEGPVVAAGDYNATMGHRPLRALLEATRMRDAHTAAGRGLARSWPQARLLPAVSLIDRVLLSDGVVVRSIGEQAMPGSDHRALVADLALSPSAPARPG
jgi:endonuclease/exonuclease/phosphatase (EEP) superfamily protein YafD